MIIVLLCYCVIVLLTVITDDYGGMRKDKAISRWARRLTKLAFHHSHFCRGVAKTNAEASKIKMVKYVLDKLFWFD